MKFRKTIVILIHIITIMNNYIDDPRILRGMEKQFELRRDRLDAGEKSIGWKVGFGAPASLEKLRLKQPLIGFLTDKILLPSSISVSTEKSWTRPQFEPEIAVYMGKDLPGDSNRETTRAAIVSLGPAIELADVHFLPEDVEAILADNIYNRNLILGKTDSSRAGGNLDGLLGNITYNGNELPAVTDVQALTGEMIDIVRHTASVLAVFGEVLRAGELIITGSIAPPILVKPKDVLAYSLEPIDSLSVNFV